MGLKLSILFTLYIVLYFSNMSDNNHSKGLETVEMQHARDLDDTSQSGGCIHQKMSLALKQNAQQYKPTAF